jgi:transcription initiation factor IIE alpha subunit
MGPCCCSDNRDVETDVLVAIYEHVGERVQLNELANELCIDEDDLRSIIIRLSAKTTVKLSFDRDTGELLIGELRVAEKAQIASGNCAYCSRPLPEGAHYCPSCGSAVN